MNISGKTVLITGASSGIGAAIAKAMCQEGAGQILLLARNEDGLRETAQAVERDSCKALIYTVNLADGAEVEAVSKRILDEVGVPDILINNAGVGQWRYGRYPVAGVGGTRGVGEGRTRRLVHRFLRGSY